MKKRVNFPCPDVLKTFSDAKLVSRTLFIPNRVSYSDRVYQFKIHSSSYLHLFLKHLLQIPSWKKYGFVAEVVKIQPFE